jgi:hypothetical protein
MSEPSFEMPKPCPVCAGVGRVHMARQMLKIKGRDVNAHQRYIVKCTVSTCGYELDASHKTDAQAVAAWNSIAR